MIQPHPGDELDTLKRETLWIGSLGTVEQRDLNKKTYEDVKKQTDKIVPSVAPFIA